MEKFEEEPMNLVAVDAEMIQTMVETQGEIITRLEMIMERLGIE